MKIIPLFSVVAALSLVFVAGCATTERNMPPIPTALAACTLPPLVFRAPVEIAPAEQSVEKVVVRAELDSASSIVERAWDKSLAGDREGTIALFNLAASHPRSNLTVDRILWSYGWAMFNLRDYPCALSRFEEARQAAPNQDSWVPQTLAITYWQMGQHDIAATWYDVAAKGAPACWSSAKAAESCTRHWLKSERRALGELVTYWKAKRYSDQ
ncbi:MAG: hypothetical protein JNN20_00675 [Betaproteobacteria bacterium]|nr:hypothetical protein [Betaproteobacteria bacterium]